MNQMIISRRNFLSSSVAVGGGMIIAFHVPTALASKLLPDGRKAIDGTEINAWLTIDPSGIVTVRTPQTEMGQGAFTSIPMMVAEELNVPWKDVRAAFADPNRHVRQNKVYKTTSTGGSRTVRSRHPYIMQAGASARERLKQAAANAWGVSRDLVNAEQGVLSHGSKKGTYGEFATAAAKINLDKEPKIKDPKDWWLLGTSVPRLDAKVKTDGSAVYPIDIKLPNMVYAAVKACPVPGGKLKSFDFGAIKDRPGVIAAIELKQKKAKPKNRDLHSGVAVVADSWWRARNALNIMPVDWDFGDGIDISNEVQRKEAEQFLKKGGELLVNKKGSAGFKLGNGVNVDEVPKLLAASDKIVTGEYHRPFETHATMMPPAAVADVKSDRVDIWTFSQDTSRSLGDAADQLGRDPKEVYVHQTFQGGGFGNGYCVDIVRQTVEISKQVKRPVQVIWPREEDIGQDSQRPPYWGKYTASLGSDGLPTALLTHLVGEEKALRYSARGVVNMPYLFPNRRHEGSAVRSNIPVGPHRAPGSNSNSFMIEQMVDELALAGGWDPLDWRIKMTEGNEPWQRVLLAMKEKAGFRTDLPKGEGMGVAVFESHGSICAACATVSVSRRGRLYVEKVSVFVNSGYVINPLNVREQIESAVVYELGTAMFGGLDIRDGRVRNTNFDSYNVMRIGDMPEVEVHLALSEDGWWGGIGEPGGPPVPPAVANAIFFATGKRIRTTPMIKVDLS